MEIFKDIPGYEGLYQVSNIGTVKSLQRKCKQYRSKSGYAIQKEKILKTTENFGYPSLQLFINGSFRTLEVHRLVAITFIDNPNNYSVVNHKNGIKNDNRVENLEWVNHRENSTHGKMQKNKTSIYPGVSFDSSRNKWVSYIYHDGKRKHLGRYKHENDAYMSTLYAHIKYNITNKYIYGNANGI